MTIMRDDNSEWKQQQEEQQQAETLVCVYCGKEKDERISCCGEMHFDQLQNTFFMPMIGTK